MKIKQKIITSELSQVQKDHSNVTSMKKKNHHFPPSSWHSPPPRPHHHFLNPGNQSPLFSSLVRTCYFFLLFPFFLGVCSFFRSLDLALVNERSTIKLFNRSHQARVSLAHRWLNKIQGFLKAEFILDVTQWTEFQVHGMKMLGSHPPFALLFSMLQ